MGDCRFLHHPWHTATHLWVGRFFFWNFCHNCTSGQHNTGCAGCCHNCGFNNLGWVNNPRCHHVNVFICLGVVTKVIFVDFIN